MVQSIFHVLYNKEVNKNESVFSIRGRRDVDPMFDPEGAALHSYLREISEQSAAPARQQGGQL